ncbi:MAG: AAA family ATPase [Anaerolineae bacterium]|nr:AAA family ATPase [Anaerolineae bacterium]
MRIKKIEICNFKGFYDECIIELHPSCKNLLVYGENGTGKSSLFQALELFLDSTQQNLDFRHFRNIFATSDDPAVPTKKEGYIKLTLRDSVHPGETLYEWSPSLKDTHASIILEANKAKAFLDYKSLLETYFLHRFQNTVNLFDLLIKNLLANSVNAITTKTFLEDWNSLEAAITGRMTEAKTRQFEQQIQDFNLGLTSRLNELEVKASEILTAFGYDLKISLEFSGIGYNYGSKPADRQITGQDVILRVRFSNKPLVRHHIFLNEAKLSAIALSIYLASVLLIPTPQLKLLVLDDVLIGLDMSNRLPVLGVLANFFPDYQKIITTYDRQWYELVRLRTAPAEWKSIEFYQGRLQDFEIPIYIESQDYLVKAREHLNAKDYKACAVYVRSEFELLLKKLADKKGLEVKYSKSPERVSSEDFWAAAKRATRRDPATATTVSMLSGAITTAIETCRKFILNPLSHSQLVNIYEQELDDAITAVGDLRTEIQSIT